MTDCSCCGEPSEHELCDACENGEGFGCDCDNSADELNDDEQAAEDATWN